MNLEIGVIHPLTEPASFDSISNGGLEYMTVFVF